MSHFLPPFVLVGILNVYRIPAGHDHHSTGAPFLVGSFGPERLIVAGSHRPICATKKISHSTSMRDLQDPF